MKKWTTLLFILLPVLFIAGSLSCKKDKCADQYCLNGGDCVDGTCKCPTGYTGEHCETQITTPGYKCVNGNCNYVSDDADFNTLSDCQSVCSNGGGGGGGSSCSGNTALTSCSGTISDGSGNSPYSNGAYCSWSISPANATSVTLNFSSFDTESGYDYVRIYDGPSASSPLIGTYSGGVIPAPVTAYSGKMYIVFTSDDSFTYQGWSATYSCNTGGGGGGGSTPGYNCVNGNCIYVNNNAQYSTSSACQSACGASGSSTITFINNSSTTASITFNGSTKTALPGGSAVFSGTPGVSGYGTAETSGKTNTGVQVGLLITWNLSYQFPNSGNNTINLNVSSDLFFLRIQNNGAGNLTNLYVNYGLVSETFDNVSISNNNQITNIGYYKAWSNTNVRAYASGIQSNVIWNSVPLPFTENQSVTLYNQYAVQIEDEK
ncbi:MAG: hypothetical protein JNL02_18360 [Saprospiraceae bacterium]|nr:hypothetical protein [Saprospiraceae bacterium]